MAKPIRELDELLRHPGFEGTPASPRQLEWLHRSYEAIFESLSPPTATGRRGPREFVFSDVVVSTDGALSWLLGDWRQANAGV